MKLNWRTSKWRPFSLLEFVPFGQPDNRSPKPKHQSCLEINSMPLAGEIRHHKAEPLDLADNFIVDSIYVFMPIDPKGIVSSHAESRMRMPCRIFRSLRCRTTLRQSIASKTRRFF
jgi:hypothetical protein